LIPPTFIHRENSSNLHSAIEGLIPLLRVDSIKKFAAVLTYLVLTEVPDGAGACLRRKGFVIKACEAIPNVFVAPIKSCAVHMLHRIVCHVLNEKKFIGDVHAIDYTLALPAQRSAMLQVLQKWLEDTLVFDEVSLPDPRWKLHLEEVLTHSFGRFKEYVRGRIQEDSESFLRAGGRSTLDAMYAKITDSITGDIRFPWVTHHERACGRCGSSREQAIQRVYCAIAETPILLCHGGQTPVAHRWGSCTEAMIFTE
jgi:hypothetical protein